MTKKIQVPMGMKDWKEEDIKNLSKIEKMWLETLAYQNFTEIRTPILESKDLFVRSAGEFSDIVSKEMFILDDLVLRPEGTAPIMRSFLNDPQSGPKYYSYFAPFFRKERPQKGRFRQFFQYGCEIIGENSPQSEITVLNIINKFYKENQVKFRFEINFIPQENGLKKYEEVLKYYYSVNLDKLCDNSKKRFKNNSFLRILDCKEDDAINCNAPSILGFLNEIESAQWNQILNLLTVLKIPFQVNPRLVRGLDYYEGFVFEAIDESNLLGSQTALGGGGRYNKLAIQIGAKENISAFGFAGGAERLLLQVQQPAPSVVDPRYYTNNRIGFVTTENSIIPELCELKDRLDRAQDSDFIMYYDVNLDTTLSFKKMFKRCDRLNLGFVVIIGKSELEQNKYKVKDLTTGQEVEINKNFKEFNFGDFFSLFNSLSKI